MARFWIAPSVTLAEGGWSDPVITVIGSPTTTVDAVPIPRLATWPASSDPRFRLMPGSVKGPDSADWTILAGSTATGTRLIPPSGHRSWLDYRDAVPGHIWCLEGLDACSLGCVSWTSGTTIPEAWAPLVNETATILQSLPVGAEWFEDAGSKEDATHVCVLPKLLPLPQYHGLPVGQIFATSLGADGFSDALDAMAAGLSAELGFVTHAWFRQWLELAASNPGSLATNWVQREDIKEAIVLPTDVTSPDKPFSLALFSLDYGLAYGLHRDCITSRMTKTVLSHFLQYEAKAIIDTFPVGTPLHGTCPAKCVYLWKARPPLHKSWHRDHGISGFVRNELLPTFFHDRLEILQGWNHAAVELPWESEDETRIRIDEADTFSNSVLAEEAVQFASTTRKRPPPSRDVVVDLSESQAASIAASGDMWDLDGRHRKVRATSIPNASVADASVADSSPDTPAADVTTVAPPPAPTATLMQYRPAVARVSSADLPFGRPKQPLLPALAFNPFQSGPVTSAPQYTTMYSPEKRVSSDFTRRDLSTDARRSLRGLLGLPSSSSSTTDWTFTNVHHGSKSVRAHAKVSSLLAIHDVAWSGFVNGSEAVPEEWKLFPGPLFHQFRDRFFGPSSSTADAIAWTRNEYREDTQTRLADHRLRPAFHDAFWCKEVFENFRLGQWGFNHPLQASDVDKCFSVFDFILSVDSNATWPPRIPADGIPIDDMVQLGKNLMWFLDLALAQPGQSGSLLLNFSILGAALVHQFELLDQRDLKAQWNASATSRKRHAYVFLMSTHRLLTEMHRWLTSEDLVFHVSPADSPLSHVMALSPMIANRRGPRGSIWTQRDRWLQMVTSTFHDHFDHCQPLREDPPAWIIRSAPRVVVSALPLAAGSAPAASASKNPQGEKKPAASSRASTRERSSSTPPAAASSSSSVPVEQRTSYPLLALSSKMPSGSKDKWPGQVLYHVNKSLNIHAPEYGPPGNSKHICFNFTTDGFAVCSGQHQGAGARRKACNRLHLSLDPSAATASDPASHYVSIVRFLQNPTVANYFEPSDVFATSQQFKDATSLL